MYRTRKVSKTILLFSFDTSEKITENLKTEREAQLHVELQATKYALRATQGKLERYSAEKLRFIESIEVLVSVPKKTN